jgi:hypothetical protein
MTSVHDVTYDLNYGDSALNSIHGSAIALLIGRELR